MPKKEKTEILKEEIARLALQRDRTGQEKLSPSERIQMLEEIYDGTLFWLKQSVIEGKSGGTRS